MSTLPADAVPHIHTEKVFAGLSDFQRALSSHMDWLRNWYSAVLNWGEPTACLPLEHDACSFSAWLNGADASLIGSFAGFAVLGELHDEVHATAENITSRAAAGHTITTSDYEAMMALVLAFGTAAQNLEREVWRTLATVDPLTGLGNRQTMMSQLVGERDRALRLNQPCCIGLCDVDHFKKVNDSHGHSTGDRVLREVADCLRGAVRPYDILYRYGGEEFLVCLPAATLEDGGHVLERMRAAVEDLRVLDRNGTPFKVTATFGVTMLSADQSVEESLERADNALYDGKRAGRNRVSFYSDDGRDVDI
ncbi:diguanylate cyclase [Paramagnetospirillum kuznetsovii]|uniref:diguanylate cyclase n=1 Tax=Paramagnetospirillum kuznetsovii TaxID=2053833 RepID=A0A364NYE9_9PROT|nr:diguanylate cyclase [Paramagnetospirillum kuznetsovii]RAU22092.1 diguanylate cyclase [Paramagnetospirillum kuznetsovii]